ncbi:hypothetical protein [Legionella sp. WA2022007384]
MAAKNKDQIDTEMKDLNERSAKGMADIREQKNKQDLDAYIAEKRKEEQMRYAKSMDELRNKHRMTSKRTGKETTHWEELDQVVEDVINSKQDAFNDWRSNMMSLLNLLKEANTTVNISVEQVAGEGWDMAKNPKEDSWTATKLLGSAIHGAGDKYTEVKSKMLHAIKGDGDLQLPTLEHKVKFKDGKVDIADLTRSDGIPLDKTNEANQAFKSMVALWLAENDYATVQNKPGEFEHYASGAVLDEDTFNRLNANPETSLSKFLKDNANLKYEEQQELHSTPTPP